MKTAEPSKWRVHGAQFGIPTFPTASAPEPSASSSPAPASVPHRHPSGAFLAYDDYQMQLVEDRMKTIMHDADMMSIMTVEPTLASRKIIMEVIKDHIRKFKRKIYGGLAINEFIKAKKPEDAFYDESMEVPDIDFYSPEPVADMKAICDRLAELKINPVEGREAQHVDTFTIFANFWKCCDISYVPKIVYNKIPVDVLPDGVQYVRPNFMFIDFLRIINDPLMSYWRLDKNFPRFAKLQKYYPIDPPQKVIDDIDAVALQAFGHATAKQQIARRILVEFLPTSSAVIIGMTAYHALMDAAGMVQGGNAKLPPSRSNAHANAQRLHKSTVLLELLTVEFAQDMAKLNELVTSIVPGARYEEFHPFYDFLGHRSHFLTPDGQTVLLRVFDNKHKCVPFMEIPIALPPAPSGGNADPRAHVVARVGTFTVTVMYLMIMRFRIRVENRGLPIDALTVHMYDSMICKMYETRNSYLAKHQVTILDDTPFKEFVIPCIGEAMHALRINQLMQEVRFRKYHFRGIKYVPSKGANFKVDDFKFMNTSGNIINSSKDRLFNPPSANARAPSAGNAAESAFNATNATNATNANAPRA